MNDRAILHVAYGMWEVRRLRRPPEDADDRHSGAFESKRGDPPPRRREMKHAASESKAA